MYFFISFLPFFLSCLLACLLVCLLASLLFVLSCFLSLLGFFLSCFVRVCVCARAQRQDGSEVPYATSAHRSCPIRRVKALPPSLGGRSESCKGSIGILWPSKSYPEHPNPHSNRLKRVVHLLQNGTIGFDPHPYLSHGRRFSPRASFAREGRQREDTVQVDFFAQDSWAWTASTWVRSERGVR